MPISLTQTTGGPGRGGRGLVRVGPVLIVRFDGSN
jgi:hypothetical protein